MGENMNKKLAFFVVGYSNWGKSATLRLFTNNTLCRYITIKNKVFILRRMSNSDDPENFEFFIRRMSNSDDPDEFTDFVKETNNRNIIVAFNPDTDNPNYDTQKLLDIVHKTHTCYFFVLKNNFKINKDPKCILEKHILNLKKYGLVSITESIDRKTRADEFKQFIVNSI